MKCQQRFIRLLAVVTLGLAAVSFSMTGMNESVTYSEYQATSLSCFPSENSFSPSAAALAVTEISQTASQPLAYLFQILFLLFLISPPLIALMLYLIWKELKAKNKMK